MRSEMGGVSLTLCLLGTILGGCGTAPDSKVVLAPAGNSAGPTVIKMEAPTTQQQAASLLEETSLRPLDLNTLRFRTDSLSLPFQGTAVFGNPGTYFNWSFVDSDPAHTTVFAQDVANYAYTDYRSWPDHGATVNATYPGMRYRAYVRCGASGEAIDDGVILTLQNLHSEESFRLSGMTPPSGPNVTFISPDTTYINANGVAWGRGWSGRVTFDSGWKAHFEKGVFADTNGRETVGGALAFIPPPSRMITVANMTSNPGTNTTLDFDISTTNSTLNRWSVDLQQNNTTIKSFSPTVDTRGPGISSGSNPLHVSLQWDGRDASNNTVAGNYTWVASANTTTFANGGAVNDGIDSVQARLDGTLTQGPITASVKQISSSSIELVNVENNPITRPQYDVDRRKKDPIALPIRDAFPVIDVTIEVLFNPEEEPPACLFWGETDGDPSQKIFGPVQRTPVLGRNSLTLPVNASEIARYPVIHWYFIALKSGGVQESMGTTDSPVYVTLDTPRFPQLKPRVDVVDYATRHAKGEKEELPILKALTEGIYEKSEFVYDLEEAEGHHTKETHFGQEFKVSNFIAFPGNEEIDSGGNCQDFANLFQVCGAALGVEGVAYRKITGNPGIKRRGFHIFPVLPVGQFNWWLPLDEQGEPDTLSFHQTGWYFGNNDVLVGNFFDPTYRMNEQAPVLPVHFDEGLYKRLFFDGSWGDLYIPQLPDRPIKVQ